MKNLTFISLICFSLILFLEMVIAFRFLSAPQIMDYHLTAIGSNWGDLTLGAQVMTLNFLRSAGVGFLMTGIAILFILIFPFRKGESWSKWALLCIGLTQAVIMGLIINDVAGNTPAEPPLVPFIVSGVLSIVGFFTYQSKGGTLNAV